MLMLLERDYDNTFEGICYGTMRIRDSMPQMRKAPKMTKFDELNQERMRSHEEYLKKNWYNKSFEIGYRTERAIAPKPDLWEALKKAKTAKEVREAYRQAGYWKSRLFKLRDHPRKFLAAKRSPRYPRSSRPSSDLKRIQYLARAMAGIHLGLSPFTSVRLLEKLSHNRPAVKPSSPGHFE